MGVAFVVLCIALQLAAICVPAADISEPCPEGAASLRGELEAFVYQLQEASKQYRDADIENMGPTRVNEYLRSLESLGYTGREEDEE